MEPSLIVVIGDHFLLRGILQDCVKMKQNVSFFPSSMNDDFPPDIKSLQVLSEDLFAQEVERDTVVLGKIKNGKSVIVEQWYIGLLLAARFIDESKNSDLEKRVLARLKTFSEIPKIVFYVSTDIEKWRNEADVQNKQHQLSILSRVLDELHLSEEVIESEYTIHHMKERTLYLLKDFE